MSSAAMKPLSWLVPVALGAAATLLYVRWHAATGAPTDAPATARLLVTEAALHAARGESAAVEPAASGDSDAILRAALIALIGQRAFDAYFIPSSIVRHIVATVDGLPRAHASVVQRPVQSHVGTFIATADDQQSPLSEANFARYQPYVQLGQKIDPAKLAAIYSHNQSLFQQAYADLGHTHESFGKRLLACIDDLLAAPEPRDPVMVIRPNDAYQFADPSLEALSAGQKLMLRIGPENEAALKAQLRALRAQLPTG